MNEFTPKTNGILNFTEDIVKKFQTELETHKFNEYTLEDNLQEFKDNNNIITLKQNYFYKQNNLFKGTINNLKYLAKQYKVDVYLTNDNLIYKSDKDHIYCSEYVNYVNNYEFDGSIKYYKGGCLPKSKEYKSFNNCKTNIIGEINLDNSMELIDYPFIITTLPKVFEERLYACAYLNDVIIPIVGYSYFNDMKKIEVRTKEKEKVTTHDNKYTYYGNGMTYGNKYQGNLFNYSDNDKIINKTEIKTPFGNDKYQVYYDGQQNYINLYKYDLRNTDYYKAAIKLYLKSKFDTEIELIYKQEEKIENVELLEIPMYNQGYKYNSLILKNYSYALTPNSKQKFIIKRKAPLVYGNKSNTFNYYNSVIDRLHNVVTHPNYQINGSYVCYEAEYGEKIPLKEKNCLWDIFTHKDKYNKELFYVNNLSYDSKIKYNYKDADKYIDTQHIKAEDNLFTFYNGKNKYVNDLTYTYYSKNKDIINIHSNMIDSDSDDNYKDGNKENIDYKIKDYDYLYYKTNTKYKYDKSEYIYKNANSEEVEYSIKRNIVLTYNSNTRAKYYNSIIEKYDKVVLHPKYGYKGVTYWLKPDKLLDDKEDVYRNKIIKEKDLLWDKFNFTDTLYKYYGSFNYISNEVYVDNPKSIIENEIKNKIIDKYDIKYNENVKYGNNFVYSIKKIESNLFTLSYNIIDEYNDEVDENDFFKSNNNFKDFYNMKYSKASKSFKYSKDNYYLPDEDDDFNEKYKLNNYKLSYNNQFKYGKNKILKNGKELNVTYRHNYFTYEWDNQEDNFTSKGRWNKSSFKDESKFITKEILYNSNIKYNNNVSYNTKQNYIKNEINTSYKDYNHYNYDGQIKYGKNNYFNNKFNDENDLISIRKVTSETSYYFYFNNEKIDLSEWIENNIENDIIHFRLKIYKDYYTYNKFIPIDEKYKSLYNYNINEKDLMKISNSFIEIYNEEFNIKDKFEINKNYKDNYTFTYNSNIKYNGDKIYIDSKRDDFNEEIKLTSCLMYRRKNKFYYGKNKLISRDYNKKINGLNYRYNKAIITDEEIDKRCNQISHKDNYTFTYNSNIKYNGKKIYNNSIKDKNNLEISKNLIEINNIFYNGKNKFSKEYSYSKPNKDVFKYDESYKEEYNYNIDVNNKINIINKLNDYEIGIYNSKIKYNKNSIFYKLNNIDNTETNIKKTYNKIYNKNQMFYSKNNSIDIYYGNLDVYYDSDDNYILEKTI